MDVSFSYEDYLLKKGSFVDQKKIEMQEITNQKELASCTFQPQVIGATKRYTLAGRKSPQARVSDFAQKKKSDEETARIAQKILQEKQKKECTFAPDMRKSTGSFKQNGLGSCKKLPGAKKAEMGYSAKHNFVSGKSSLRQSCGMKKKAVVSEIEAMPNYGDSTPTSASKVHLKINDDLLNIVQGKMPFAKEELPEVKKRQPEENETSEDKYNTVKPQFLYLDANLGHGKTERLTIYAGDDPNAISLKFAQKHGKLTFLLSASTISVLYLILIKL